MPDFLAAVEPNQGAVVLGRWVPRARFGLHLQLGRLAERAQAAYGNDDPGGYFRAIAEYLHLCGVSPWRFRLWRFGWRYRGQELRAAFETLIELNKLRWALPFMEPGGDKQLPAPYDYTGRYWAWLVDRLASRYGWQPGVIFDLWPEEAMSYLQEVIIAGYVEADWNRSLSEVAYEYDPQTKKSYFKPLPRPGWMIPQQPERKIRVRRAVMPYGTVVNVSDLPN